MNKDEQLKLQKSLARASDREQLVKSGAGTSPLLSGVIVYFLTEWFPLLVPKWGALAWILWFAFMIAIYLGVKKMADDQYVDSTD